MHTVKISPQAKLKFSVGFMAKPQDPDSFQEISRHETILEAILICSLLNGGQKFDATSLPEEAWEKRMTDGQALDEVRRRYGPDAYATRLNRDEKPCRLGTMGFNLFGKGDTWEEAFQGAQATSACLFQAAQRRTLEYAERIRSKIEGLRKLVYNGQQNTALAEFSALDMQMEAHITCAKQGNPQWQFEFCKPGKIMQGMSAETLLAAFRQLGESEQKEAIGLILEAAGYMITRDHVRHETVIAKQEPNTASEIAENVAAKEQVPPIVRAIEKELECLNSVGRMAALRQIFDSYILAFNTFIKENDVLVKAMVSMVDPLGLVTGVRKEGERIAVYREDFFKKLLGDVEKDAGFIGLNWAKALFGKNAFVRVFETLAEVKRDGETVVYPRRFFEIGEGKRILGQGETLVKAILDAEKRGFVKVEPVENIEAHSLKAVLDERDMPPMPAPQVQRLPKQGDSGTKEKIFLNDEDLWREYAHVLVRFFFGQSAYAIRNVDQCLITRGPNVLGCGPTYSAAMREAINDGFVTPKRIEQVVYFFNSDEQQLRRPSFWGIPCFTDGEAEWLASRCFGVCYFIDFEASTLACRIGVIEPGTGIRHVKGAGMTWYEAFDDAVTRREITREKMAEIKDRVQSKRA